MRAHYVVYAQGNYVIERFRGPVTFAELQKFLARQADDERIAPHYHTISDYTQASLRLSNDDVQRFAALLCTPSHFRTGKRAIVFSNVRILAYASVFAARLAHTELIVQCFQHRHAALQWINPGAAIEQTGSKWPAVQPSSIRISLKSVVSP